jgi:aryl-phospho-beta-D-glucosidase BglC (GH1 family)
MREVQEGIGVMIDVHHFEVRQLAQFHIGDDMKMMRARAIAYTDGGRRT